MANIDLGNLTRYDGKIKQYTEDKYLSKNTANWQMTEKAGAVTCYPVPDTELEPIVDFSFKEVPPANGDKSPSNPSTITGMNSIKVTRCGKNLFKRPYQTASGSTIYTTTFSVDNETGIVIANTPTSSSNNAVFWLNGSTSSVRLVGGKMYYLSGCPSGGSENTYRLGLTIYSLKHEPTGPSFYEYGNGCLIAPSVDCYFVATATVRAGATVSNLVFKPMLEEVTVATAFEPYSGTDYTIQFGNTYYGGSVNLATGEMIITHGKYEIQGTEWWSSVDNDGYTLDAYNSTTGIGWSYFVIGNYGLAPSIRANSVQDPNIAKCSHFNLNPCNYGVGTISINNGQITEPMMFASGTQYRFAFPYSTLTDWKAYLVAQKEAGTPVTIVYELANPYTVQLDPVQIKSLTALDKNTPRLNTLYTDADSIQVGYQKHPARTAYELENAILALGGGE